LLLTLSHENAITTVGFRPVTGTWKGLTPSCSNAFTGALAIIAPRDEARSQDDDRFNLASNELRSSFLYRFGQKIHQKNLALCELGPIRKKEPVSVI
jgi:hypothetical protein